MIDLREFEPSQSQKLILEGKVCQYCKKPTKLVAAATVFKNGKHLIHYCEPCFAYTGTHRGTNKSLGTVAKKDLREWRKATHYFFDKLWINNKKTRSDWYVKLSEFLMLKKVYTHIGMFSIDYCKNTIRFAVQELNKRNHNLDAELIIKMNELFIQKDAKIVHSDYTIKTIYQNGWIAVASKNNLSFRSTNYYENEIEAVNDVIEIVNKAIKQLKENKNAFSKI